MKYRTFYFQFSLFLQIWLFMTAVNAQEPVTTSVFSPENNYVLHPENIAPFMENPDEDVSSFSQINQFGAYNLFVNGLKSRVNSKGYLFNAGYYYRNSDGYRKHSQDYGHNFNVYLKAAAGKNSALTVTGTYTNGLTRMPGSLTNAEFAVDPYAADQRPVNRDEQRVATRGKLGVNFTTSFGKNNFQEISIGGFGKADYVKRLTKEYKIIDRQGFGADFSWTGKMPLFGHANKISLGGKIQTQPDGTQVYENFSGIKSDQIEELKSAVMNNSSLFFSDRFDFIRKMLYAEFRLNYDRQVFETHDEILPSRTGERTYEAVTPSLRLTIEPNRQLKFYALWKHELTQPTEKQLEDSPIPANIFNMELDQQILKKGEIGLTSGLISDTSSFLQQLSLDARLFIAKIDHEIVGYEVYGEEYCRNAAASDRQGIRLAATAGFSPGLELTVDYTFSHFRYKTYQTWTLETDSTGNLLFYDRNFSGNREPDIPVHQFRFDLAYHYDFSQAARIFAQINGDYRTGFWMDDLNSEQTSSATVMNFAIGLHLSPGNFELGASGGLQNAFDAVYVDHATINSADKRYYNAAAPRSWFATLNIAYKLQ